MALTIDGSDPTGDLGDLLAAKLPYSYGTATPSTTDSGFLWYDSNSTPAAPKFWDGAAFQALTSGRIVQIVRDTDTTNRTTTSNSLTDVTGMSVTITPTKSDSAVLIIAAFTSNFDSTAGDKRSAFSITDSSNNAISGSETHFTGNVGGTVTQGTIPLALFAWATPATTSAVTYKLRFRTVAASGTSTQILNSQATGQLFAIEVAA